MRSWAWKIYNEGSINPVNREYEIKALSTLYKSLYKMNKKSIRFNKELSSKQTSTTKKIKIKKKFNDKNSKINELKSISTNDQQACDSNIKNEISFLDIETVV
jgi:hypothetical protein